MKVTIVDWNVNGWHTITDAQIELIRSFSPDVVTLQEVTPRSFEKLEAAGLGVGETARTFLPPGHRGAAKGSKVRFWAALFVREDWGLRNAQTLDGAPSPERSVTARVTAPMPFVAASFAVPPGVTWFEQKREQGVAIARWLESRRMPVLAGIDRNGPRFEGPDGVTMWRHDAPELVEPGRLKRTRDVHAGDGTATSYVRGRGDRSIPCRYDAIYASTDFDVEEVEYVYDAAIEAGSDHGLVVARLDLS